MVNGKWQMVIGHSSLETLETLESLQTNHIFPPAICIYQKKSAIFALIYSVIAGDSRDIAALFTNYSLEIKRRII